MKGAKPNGKTTVRFFGKQAEPAPVPAQGAL
jgi:hypothetical protein